MKNVCTPSLSPLSSPVVIWPSFQAVINKLSVFCCVFFKFFCCQAPSGQGGLFRLHLFQSWIGALSMKTIDIQM